MAIFVEGKKILHAFVGCPSFCASVLRVLWKSRSSLITELGTYRGIWENKGVVGNFLNEKLRNGLDDGFFGRGESLILTSIVLVIRIPGTLLYQHPYLERPQSRDMRSPHEKTS
jgi:hypothetical protein